MKIASIILSGLFFVPLFAHAATLSFSTPTTTIPVGTEFPLYVYASSTDRGFNAAEGTISFPNGTLEVVSIDSVSSTVFNFWLTRPTFSNEDGKVVFAGGTTNGVSGSDIPLLLVHMRAKGVGDALITASDASINASDGSGTNILNDVEPLRLAVSPETMMIPPKPASPPAPLSASPASPETQGPVTTEDIPAFGKKEKCTGLFKQCDLHFPKIDTVSIKFHEQVGADLFVSGTATDGSHVHLLLYRDDVPYKEITAIVKPDGNWEGILANIYSYGSYHLNAWAENKDNSRRSQPVTKSNIDIYPPYTLLVFGYVLRWYMVAVAFVCAVVLLLGAFLLLQRYSERYRWYNTNFAIATFSASLLALAVTSFIAYNGWQREYGAKATFWKDTRIPCVIRGHSFIDILSSTQLSIFIDGEPQLIPTEIGYSPQCVANIHTHDTTGRLHFEAPATIADFFTVANIPLERKNYTLEMTVNGSIVPSEQITTYQLRDEDTVVITYTKQR